ncbi:NADH:flavin oxidoreductase/NADH oxidase family protein [Gordonia sp. NPDC003376]
MSTAPNRPVVQNPLGSSLTLPCGVVTKNRFFKSAMNEALAGRDAAPTEYHIHLYEQWARGGTGIVVTGNVMVDRDHLGEPGNVAVDDERDLDLLRRWAQAGTADRTQLWMQLNHPGKQSPRTINDHPVAPSAVPIGGRLAPYFVPPRELTVDEIGGVVRRFVTSAGIAKKAGFTGVEIHAAHGYLANQFLSPRDNRRTDEYGGSLENRMRFLVEVYQGIRTEVGPEFPVGVKLNSSDGVDGGLSEEDSLRVATRLSELGVDVIDISGGTSERPTMQGANGGATAGHGAFFRSYARRLAELVDTPIALTGGFRSTADMEQAVVEGYSGLVGLARPLVLMPDLPNRVLGQQWHGTVDLPWITTHIPALDRSMGKILANNWYELQMYRVGRGKSLQKASGIASLVFTIRRHGPGALVPRRA